MKQSVTLFFLLSWMAAHGQTSSVLSSGKWYKLSVQLDGVYKIDYSLLRKLGISPDQVDPAKIQVYGGVNGMLPQANSSPRINELKELSIFVKGGEDGKFNKGDYILFFGQGPDSYQLIPGKKIFGYQNHLYADKNFYFLTLGNGGGRRMTDLESLAGNFPVSTGFDDFAYYETERFNDLHSGRDWFGEQFDTKSDYTIRFEIPGIIEGSSITLVSNVMAQSFSETSFQLSYNSVLIGEQKVPPIANAQYAPKGIEITDTLVKTSTTVKAATQANQDIRLKFIKAATGRSVGYLDYLLLQTKRKLALYGDQTIFHSLRSLDQPVTSFSIAAMPIDGMVWDVTDPFNARIQRLTNGSGAATFAATSVSLRKYIALSNKNYPLPAAEGEVPNQNLHGLTSLDFLIVSAPEFLLEAQRLASHRQSKNSLSSVVATTTQVYNEFSGGKQDITAIRDLVKYLYDSNSGIKYLLLFGRGSYDYKNYLPYNKNFVPTYESRNSLSPLETYSSDDYFAFLENNEGNWGENPAEAHTMDIGVGRLPVKKIEEAKTVVTKIIQYENQNWGDWRKEILFVADDGDYNIHQGQADQMAETIEANHPEFNTQKIYLDAFQQKMSQIGQVSPEATTALSNAVRKGVVIVNYTGHGNEQQWMQERILDQVSLDKWKTASRYPLLVTATCEFGRNDDPGLISTAELSLIKKDGGSIGLVTTARPVNSSTNFTLNKAFYQSLLTKDQNQFRPLGAVLRDTKNNSIAGVSNRNFSLLGDPSMKLALPESEVRVTQIINLSSGSDTLKGLSKIRLIGRVYRNGLADAGYKGTVSIALYDKATSGETKGDENPPFAFKGRENAVFHGQASIRDGQFEIEFIIPKSINPAVGSGKISLYAFSETNGNDVTGIQVPVKIGSLEKLPGTDSKGPTIELYMGDTTFVDGGISGSDSRIVAILSDENGINTSNFIPQNNITATLDDTVTFMLNKYYQSDVDNPKRGKVSYPVDDMKPGLHYITLRASDTFSNTSSASISFTVSDQPGIQIEQWISYPNPVTSSTTFHFKHNRSGEDLEAVVTVYDQVGQPMTSNTYLVNGSAYQVDLPVWNATTGSGTKLTGGLYLLKLSVRSLLDGSKNEKITKVIISN